MNAKSLIDETLKYLEKDKNNQPKYKFEIYTTGMDNYFRQSLNSISGNLLNLQTTNEDRVPVTVYTIGDIFTTVKDLVKDGKRVANGLNNLGDKLEEIKVIATGGLNSMLQPITDVFDFVDKDLTLAGMKRIADSF